MKNIDSISETLRVTKTGSKFAGWEGVKRSAPPLQRSAYCIQVLPSCDLSAPYLFIRKEEGRGATLERGRASLDPFPTCEFATSLDAAACLDITKGSMVSKYLLRPGSSEASL